MATSKMARCRSSRSAVFQFAAIYIDVKDHLHVEFSHTILRLDRVFKIKFFAGELVLPVIIHSLLRDVTSSLNWGGTNHREVGLLDLQGAAVLNKFGGGPRVL